MAKSFDAYHKWLAIPPKEQPPNHYRLLGTTLFEPDLDVISNAADQRMAHVRSLQTGAHGDVSQAILNEIAQAKVCLLDDERKTAYDKSLRDELHPKSKPVVAKRLPTAVPIGEVVSPLPTQPSHDATKTIVSKSGPLIATPQPGVRRSSRRKNYNALIAVAVSIVIIGAAGLIVAKNLGQKEPHEHSADDKAAVARVKNDTGADADSPKPNANESPAPPIAQSNTPKSKLQVDEPQPDSDSGAPNAARPTIDNKDPAPSVVDTNSVSPGQAFEKVPVPAAAEQQKVEAKVRDIFGDQIASAETHEDLIALAKALIQQARANGVDATGQYVLLRLAGTVATKAGDAEVCLTVVDEMASLFDIDELAMRVSAIKTAAKSLKGKEFRNRSRKLTDAITVVIQEAVEANDYEAAIELGSIAIAAARKVKDVELIKQFAQTNREIGALASAYADVRDSFAALDQNPEHAVANEAAGRFLCFVKGDWKGGLQNLAKGGDETLKALAAKDMSQPIDVAEQIALGDGWWRLANSQSESSVRDQIASRAAHWYGRALPKSVGLEKTKVEARLAKLNPPSPDAKKDGEGGEQEVVETDRRAVVKYGASGASVVTMTNGVRLCSNRTYGFIGIPPQMQGLKMTQVIAPQKMGGRHPFGNIPVALSATNETVFIIFSNKGFGVSQAHSFLARTGWTRSSAQLTLSDKSGAKFSVFGKRFMKAESTTFPRMSEPYYFASKSLKIAF
jgi:hypothetical protein